MKVLVNFPNEFLSESEKKNLPLYKGIDKTMELDMDFLNVMINSSEKLDRPFKKPVAKALLGKKLSHSEYDLLNRHFEHMTRHNPNYFKFIASTIFK